MSKKEVSDNNREECTDCDSCDCDALKKEIADLKKQLAETKDKLYVYSGHISKLNSMITVFQDEQKASKRKFIFKVADVIDESGFMLSALKLLEGLQNSGAKDKVIEAFEALRTKCVNVLSEYKVIVIEMNVGDDFSYDTCSVQSVTNDNGAPNKITKVYSNAYMLDGVCIRRASVDVSSIKN